MDDAKEAKTVKKIQLSYFVPLATYILISLLIFGATTGFFYSIIAVLLIIGLIGSIMAAFNGRTAIAAVSGAAILLSCFAFEHWWKLAPISVGSLILATAFITHCYKALHKLRVVYFIPLGTPIFLLFAMPDALLPQDVVEAFLLMAFYLFLSGVAWSTIAGFNNFMYPNASVSGEEEKAEKRISLWLMYFIPLAIYLILPTDDRIIKFSDMLVFMLLLIGIIESIEAAFSDHTVIAAISGIIIMTAYLIPFHPNSWRLASFFVGLLILAIAFITHINKGLSKLRLFYLTPAIMFVFWGFKFLHYQAIVIFEPSISILELCIAISISLLALWAARSTVVGLNLVLCPSALLISPLVSGTLVDENITYSNTPSDNAYTGASIITDRKKRRILKTTLCFLIYAMAFAIALSTALFSVGASGFLIENLNI